MVEDFIFTFFSIHSHRVSVLQSLVLLVDGFWVFVFSFSVAFMEAFFPKTHGNLKKTFP